MIYVLTHYTGLYLRRDFYTGEDWMTHDRNSDQGWDGAIFRGIAAARWKIKKSWNGI